MTDFEQITGEYVQELRKQFAESRKTGEMTAELSYRPLLDKYFDKLSRHYGKDISRIFEPKQQAHAGRPDWRFYDAKTLGVHGYVEAKALAPDSALTPDSYRSQLDSYLLLGYPVILTDGLDFIFFYPSHKVKQFSITDKPNWTLNRDIGSLDLAFRQFFARIEARAISEEQLVHECAKRACILRDRIATLSDLPQDSGADATENAIISVLIQLRQVVNKHNDPALAQKSEFAAFVSQVLIFGLIYAHRVTFHAKDSPSSRYMRIRKYWQDLVAETPTTHLRPFCALVQILQPELVSLGLLGTWYDDCCLFLAHVRLDEKQFLTPDYHKLFELFLKDFDPKTRFDYGAFYTPQELTRYMVNLVDVIARTNFPKSSLYDSKNKLIDPCCGTGSFLEELLTSSLRSKAGKPQIIGFEILPGPYALAHYRIFSLTDKFPENLEIMLTNTLSDHLGHVVAKDEPTLFDVEQSVASELSKPPITLIIGNPPSSDSFNRSSGTGFKIINSLLDDFRPPKKERKARSNLQKQLNNEYVKFIRWSVEKILEGDSGILAIVVPGSFAEHASYKYARQWLTGKFSDFWILDLDIDARSGENSSSIFNTLQGRTMLVALRKPANTGSKIAPEFYYRTIANLVRHDKLAELGKPRNKEKFLGEFSAFIPQADDCNFRPRKAFDSTIYDRFWDIALSSDVQHNYIFARHCSGVKLAPSSLFIHVSAPVLHRRCLDIADKNKPVNDLVKDWFKGQDRPPTNAKFTSGIRAAFSNAMVGKPTFARYSYRPFLTTPALLSDTILTKLAGEGGGGTRYRPEVLSAYSASSTIGVAIAPATKDLGGSLRRFTSFVWHTPDNDLCKRGNAHVFCNNFPEYHKRNKQWDNTPVTNVNPCLTSRLSCTAEDVVYYVYAILCSPLFLKTFETPLFGYAGASAKLKVPITSDAALFSQLSSLGKQLASLEEIPENDATSHGDIPSDFRLKNWSFDANKRKFILFGYASDSVMFNDVSSDVANFEVSGYQVLHQWLKMHAWVYSRTVFTVKHCNAFATLLRNIESQFAILSQVDASVQKILDSGKLL